MASGSKATYVGLSAPRPMLRSFRSFRFRSILVVAAVSLSLSSTARADVPPSPGLPGPRDDAEVRARLAFVQPHLRDAAPVAQRWYWGWVAGFTAGAVGSFGSLLVLKDEGLRGDAVVGGTLSTLGAVTTLALPMVASSAPSVLDAMPESTDAERAAKLRRAEELTHEAAEQERFLTSALAHVGGVVVTVGAAAVQRVGYDREWGAILLGRTLGLLVGEAKVLSTPTAAIRDEGAYRAAFPIMATVVPTLGGAAIVGVF